ncbi:hypothetical protein [Pseudocitrobacter cyperus]|uniref:Inner membrane protein n=1 Tax=Pseudocitrobacter cyperus TaxID=3112843 RepID=A0ABV0HPK5_9ENTR
MGSELFFVWLGMLEVLASLIYIFSGGRFRILWGGCLFSLCASLVIFLIWPQSFFGRYLFWNSQVNECSDLVIVDGSSPLHCELGWWFLVAGLFFFILAVLTCFIAATIKSCLRLRG